MDYSFNIVDICANEFNSILMRFKWIILMSIFLGACGNPYYQGPKTDHFDGERFSAPEPIEKKNWLAVAKWRFSSKPAKWPEHVDIQTDKPPAHVQGDELRVTFVNHATILIQTQGMNILTDPVWSERVSPISFIGPKRVNEPGIQWNDLPKIDVVLISHAHYDHLDLPTVKKLVKRDDPLFIVPLGVDTIIHGKVKQARTKAIDWSQSITENKVTIHAEPTQHWSARTPFDNSMSLWASYILQFGDEKLYFSGDTGYASGKIFKEIGKKYGPIRFAMIGIGAYEPRWFMKDSHIAPFEAVQIYQDINAEYAMPMHFGTFQLSDEGRDQPVQDLNTALDKAGISKQKFKALWPGQHWIVPKK
jgi:L-ascorbate metabolism protein UlaG (beta-lactamase superfamily)